MPAQNTPCPNGTLVGQAAGATVLAPSRCRRWRCDHCGPRKANALRKRIAQTPTNRLVTLTARRNPHVSAQKQLDDLNHAWRTIWKRIRRAQPTQAKGYVRIVELTKNRTPHLHIAVQCGYVHQRTLSRWMLELTGSPIVDIRRVDSQRGVARYLAKYLTKDAETVENRRKWSATPRWMAPTETATLEPGELAIVWRWTPGELEAIESTYVADGYERSPYADGVLIPVPW